MSNKLLKLFVVPSLRYKTIGKEAKECIEFSNYMKAATLNNSFVGVFFHVANEFSGNKNPNFGILLKHMGKINGVSDFVIIHPSKTIMIEFKKKGETLSENQKIFRDWCIKAGIDYYLVYLAVEAIEILKKTGMVNASQ